jgi:hypothetical protein
MSWKAAIRNTLVVALLGALYVAFRIHQRNADNEAFEQCQEQKREQRDGPLPDIYKSDKIEILSFYVVPRGVSRGEKASLCYGVLNAATLATEPSTGELTPSMSRCVEVRPAQTTTYKLTAKDGKGGEKSAEATLAVR